MPASNHLNHQQLRLFMTADEMMDLPTGDSETWASLRKEPELVKRKLTEGILGPEDFTHGEHAADDEPTLFESIKEHGVKEPITLRFVGDHSTPVIANGNHRIAIAHHLDPNTYLIPEYDSIPSFMVPSSGSIHQNMPDFPLSNKKKK